MATSVSRVGRRRSTTCDHITDVALDLFAAYGFERVSADDIALSAGIARRTLFRYFPSKNAIPWGDFDSYLRHFGALLDSADPALPLRDALRAALLDFNTFDDNQITRHRLRMSVILQTEELQAYSMTMYAGWRAVVARFVGRRLNTAPSELVPQTIAWTLLSVALAGHEHWLDHPWTPLRECLGAAFDTVAGGLP
ncbi:MAG: mycofactocin system transcriptional regulator [Mycobacterium sp.]|nr:mycofactocin system transcriptional regulator [Mycobacterium sp.]